MITKKSLLNAVHKYQRRMHIHDEILYEMCKGHPKHRNFSAVLAKSSIIGRSYQTGIERKIQSDGSQGSALGQLAQHLFSNRRNIDGIVERLADLSNSTSTLDDESAKVVIEEHGKFVRIIEEITRDRQSSRSFCSKYLHFHCPLVPIYDSVVSKRIPSLIPWNTSLATSLDMMRLNALRDWTYARYVIRFLHLYERVGDLKLVRPVSVKELDYYLLTS
jgi:hypothetical protein